MTDHLLGFIGLMRKAGKIETGDMAAVSSIKENKAKVAVAVSDAGQNIKKKIERIACEQQIPFVLLDSTNLELSHYIGKDNTSVFTITDPNFAKAFLAKTGSMAQQPNDTERNTHKKEDNT